MLGGYARERRRQRHPPHRCGDRVGKRTPARADRVRLGARLRRQPDSDVTPTGSGSSVTSQREVAARGEAPRLARPSPRSRPGARRPRSCSSRSSGASLKCSSKVNGHPTRCGSGAFALEPRRERVFLATGPRLALVIRRQCQPSRLPSARAPRRRWWPGCGSSPPLSARLSDRHDQRRVRAVRIDECVAELQRTSCRSRADMSRFSILGPAQIKSDRSACRPVVSTVDRFR